MKILQKTLFTLTALFGLTLASQAAVVVDDTWSTSAYTNWNLPYQSPWYYNNSTTNLYLGAIENALVLTNFDESNFSLVTGTRQFWTYFTTNAPDMTVWGFSNTNGCSNATNAIYGHPVDIELGQMLTMTLRFSPSGFIQDTGSKGLRFGLLCYETNLPDGALTCTTPLFGRAARSTANISKSGTNVTGYLLDLALFANLTNNSMFSFRVRTNLNGIDDCKDVVGKTSTYLSMGGGPSLTNISGFQADQDYTFQWTVARYATANQVSAKISGPLAGVPMTNFSRAYLDNSGSNYHKFDTFMIRVDGSSLVADRLVLKEFKVETLLMPPFNITTAHAIDANNFRLIWESLAGQNYRIDSKDTLAAATWTSNATVTAAGTTTTWTNAGTSTASQRFYRVVNTP
jgi:hypothetical protein